MNDHTTPSSDPDDHAVGDRTFDDNIIEALREVPGDMDELFARRAIDAAVGSVGSDAEVGSVGSVGRDTGPAGSSRRGRVRITAAAAVIVVVAAIGALALFSGTRGSSLATSSDGAARSESAQMSDGQDVSTDSIGGTRFIGEFDLVDDLLDAAVGTDRYRPSAAPADEGEARRDQGLSGAATDDLVTTTAPDRDAMDDMDDIDDEMEDAERADSVPVTRDEIDRAVETCSAELISRDLAVLGWAMLDSRPVVVVTRNAPEPPMIFDAMTCNA